MTEIVDEIRTRGHWEVVIRPATFRRDLIPEFAGLEKIVRQNVVHLRGWEFPYVDPDKSLERYQDSVGQESSWGPYLENWRFFQSGQFFDLLGMEEDWMERESWGRRGDWPVGKYLSVGNTIFTITEIFEFASRLCIVSSAIEEMRVEFRVGSLQERELRHDRQRGMLQTGLFTSTLRDFEYGESFATSQLVGNAWTLAAQAAKNLFQHFGWDPSDHFLTDQQKRLRQFRGGENP